MTHSRLNAYRIMWLFVFFDLPTTTDTEKKKHAKFRKDLLKDGFSMLQLSVYIRHCASKESAQVHTKWVENMLPSKGQVSILEITDKQYGNMKNFWGKSTTPTEKPPAQLEIF